MGDQICLDCGSSNTRFRKTKELQYVCNRCGHEFSLEDVSLVAREREESERRAAQRWERERPEREERARQAEEQRERQRVEAEERARQAEEQRERERRAKEARDAFHRELSAEAEAAAEKIAKERGAYQRSASAERAKGFDDSLALRLGTYVAIAVCGFYGGSKVWSLLGFDRPVEPQDDQIVWVLVTGVRLMICAIPAIIAGLIGFIPAFLLQFVRQQWLDGRALKEVRCRKLLCAELKSFEAILSNASRGFVTSRDEIEVLRRIDPTSAAEFEVRLKHLDLEQANASGGSPR